VPPSPVSHAVMSHKFGYIGLGIVLIVYGVFRCFRRVYHDLSYDYSHDIGPYHWVLGVLAILLGPALLMVSFRKKSGTERNDS